MGSDRYRILILPQAHVLDVQGRAVEKALERLDFPKSEIRIGRLIEVTLESGASAKSLVQKMTEEVFYNPLIETYQIEQIKTEGPR